MLNQLLVSFLINLEFSYLTPPFGYTLFYLKGICSKDISTNDIYTSTIPFGISGCIGNNNFHDDIRPHNLFATGVVRKLEYKIPQILVY